MHDGLRVRFRYPSGSGSDYDYWAVDNVTITVRNGEQVPAITPGDLNDGENTVAARLRNDADDVEDAWVTDAETQWADGSLLNVTATGGNLTLASATGVSPSDVDAGNYCSVAGGDTSSGEYIDRVTVTGIDRTTGDNGGYIDATDSVSDRLTPGRTYQISVTMYTDTGFFSSTTQYASVVFDWDNDTSLTDETVYEIGSCSSDGCTVSTDITVPSDAEPSSTLMRVMGEAGGYHTTPCSDPSSNEIEDYSAYVDTGAYATDGNYTSTTFDAGTPVDWQSADVTAAVPTDTTYAIDYSNTTHWFDTLAAVPDSQRLLFNTSLRTTNASRTPGIDQVAVRYSGDRAGFALALNATERRERSMIVMSDGDANVETDMTDVPDHDGDGDVDADDHAIEAGCRAQQDHNVTVHAVGFGSGADNATLNATAQCGNGTYYFSSTGELESIFRNISENILNASFVGQTVETTGDGSFGRLYPDSVLQLNYSRNDTMEFGTYSLELSSPRFGGNVTSPKNGSFTVPAGATVTDAAVTSYSANFWTDRLSIENASGMDEEVYRLWDYGSDYRDLGDPYAVNIPVDAVQGGTNNVSIDTGLSRTQRRGGSPDDRVLYTVAVRGAVGYGDAYGKSEGGTYTFPTVGGNVTVTVGNASDPWNASNDATDDAAERLIDRLDLDGDGVVDFRLEDGDVAIDALNTGGIEWLWGPATVSLEVWQE